MALYLPKFNLLFIHIYKTAGTSTRLAFHKLDPGYGEIGGLHADIKELEEHVEGKNLMTIVRNPYDWVYSLYHYCVYHASHPFHAYCTTHDFDQFTSWYIQNMKKLSDDTSVNGKLQSQTEYITLNGKIRVQTILKMENLEVELNQFFKDFFRNARHIALDYRNVTPYTKVNPETFSRATLDLINQRFADDFKNFNYKMI